jgi:hypothetical protein
MDKNLFLFYNMIALLFELFTIFLIHLFMFMLARFLFTLLDSCSHQSVEEPWLTSS